VGVDEGVRQPHAAPETGDWGAIEPGARRMGTGLTGTAPEVVGTEPGGDRGTAPDRDGGDGGDGTVLWNLRVAAAQRGIWRPSELRQALVERGLSLSPRKMSYLWSGQPVTIRLDDLAAICGVLDCHPNDLLVRVDAPVERETPESLADEPLEDKAS
jgi:putative transcriptional regulator